MWATYKEKIHHYAGRIVEAQRPIRILDAIKWDPSVEQEFKRTKMRVMPQLGPEYYARIDLGFDPLKKIAELEDIARDLKSAFGDVDDLGALMIVMVEEYRDVVSMLMARGTKEFWEWSRKLYGSPKTKLAGEQTTIAGLAQKLYGILGHADIEIPDHAEPLFSAAEGVVYLNERLSAFFGSSVVVARISDGIVADAAAGGDVIKLKEGAFFKKRDLDLLEVHEGWVHAATTQNGMMQHVATWLSKGTPRSSATQEGLAVMMEIFTFRSYPLRARHINDRVLGIDKAEDGANFLELIEFYRTEGYTEDESWRNVQRIFRGGVLEGGAPFTKDISYCRGFVENYNFIRSVIALGYVRVIPFLFAGKVHIQDVPLLYAKSQEKIIDPPRFLPPQFQDMGALAVWMSFSQYLNVANLEDLQKHYTSIFSKVL